MERKVKRVQFINPVIPKRKRVAAYARVSSAKDAMHHSLSAQVSYYSSLIQSCGEWEYAGVYADEAKTGTKDSRQEFARLIADCKAGKVDMIITKSVSRFARNTVTLLSVVRELKAISVDVFFEEQNIHTLSADGELMLTILASYAQEESLSASENQKWRVRKNFQEGKPWNGTILGYRYNGGQLVIKSDEAETVRKIFRLYLSGWGYEKIAKQLMADGDITRFGHRNWEYCEVKRILKNYTYTGNLILQTTYRDNHINKKTLPNTGELPQYQVRSAHEPIIDIDAFCLVQEEIIRRSESQNRLIKPGNTYPFTSLITCAHCGKHYRRKTRPSGYYWICTTYNAKGKSACPSKQIPESILTETLSDLDVSDIEQIIAEDDNQLTIIFKNGTTETRRWQDRSRSESWTEEMKANASKQSKARWQYA